MERRKFEESFKEAFDGAEISPSENVWTNIELDLEKAEGGKIRRRLLFYKMLAAASVTFAMCIAGIGYYMVNDRDQRLSTEISTNPTTQEDQVNEDSQPDSNPSNLSENVTDLVSETPAPDERYSIKNKGEDQLSSGKSGLTKNNNGEFVAEGNLKNAATDPSILVVDRDVEDGLSFTSDSRHEAAERQLPTFYKLKNPALTFQNSKPDPGMLLLARLADEERAYAEQDKREEKNKSEKLWTSVGFAAGGFSSINSSVESTPQASNFVSLSNSSVPDKQAKASGVAYSFGVNIGTKLSERWVLQGGVNYLTQSSDYVATNVVADNNFLNLTAESINALDKSAVANTSSRLAPTFPYSVNNNVQFFSVPVQAGYLVVNKKFGLQLNAGLSTDLFLQNTITPEGGSLDKTTQGRGDESPYRSVNFSGLMGTELTYKFGQRYRVALNPGLRYPINSVYKTDVGIQSSPLTFDVGLRFRYIFQ